MAAPLLVDDAGVRKTTVPRSQGSGNAAGAAPAGRRDDSVKTQQALSEERGAARIEGLRALARSITPREAGKPIECDSAGARAMTTTTTTEAKLLTADDLLRLSGEGVRGELIRGVLCETMATGHRHGTIVVRLSAAILGFAEPRALGTVVASDSGVLLERDPDTVREPDIAFFSAQKIPVNAEIAGYPEAIPDLVVEVTSPSDSRREVHDKARMWLSHGVRLVWVVHPETRTVDVYRPDGDAATLAEQDALDGLEVLPGFTCEVSAVFGPRPAEERDGQDEA